MEEIIKYIQDGIDLTFKKQNLVETDSKQYAAYEIERFVLQDVLNEILEIKKRQLSQ